MCIFVLTLHCSSSSLCCLRMGFASALLWSRSALYTRGEKRAKESKICHLFNARNTFIAITAHLTNISQLNSLTTAYFYSLHTSIHPFIYVFEKIKKRVEIGSKTIPLCPAVTVLQSVEWQYFARAERPFPESAVPTKTLADPKVPFLHSTDLAEKFIKI